MPIAERRHIRWAAYMLGTAAVVGFALATAFPIAPLLPAEGERTCFGASFDASKQLVFGWPHEKGGEPAPVTRMSVRFEREAGQEPHWDRGTGYGFDWRYTAIVKLTVSNRAEVFSAPTSCDWSRHSVSAWLPSLGCWIDCDGGGIVFERVPGQIAVSAHWPARTHLRMSGCGGGGAILRAGDESKSFRLDAIPQSACAAMAD